jgi:hypothetical protein
VSDDAAVRDRPTFRASPRDSLRAHPGLTGTNKGCDVGQRGSCSGHIDGKPALSCLTLAVSAEGPDITTIGRLAPAPAHPAFPGRERRLPTASMAGASSVVRRTDHPARHPESP